MADCLYYLNMSGDENPVLNDENKIGNEVDLDGYIYDHRDELLLNLDQVDLTFSLPVNAKQEDVVKYIKNNMQSEAERWFKSSKKYNITAAWDDIDPDTFERLEKNTNFPIPEDGAKYNVMGEIVGKWLQVAIEKGEEGLNALIPDNSIYKPEYSSKTENFYRTLKEVSLKVANILKNKFKDAEFIFEASVSTTNLTNDFKSLLNSVSKKTTGDVIEAILGRIDITAVLPDGSTATIELKTTGKTLPKNISPESFNDDTWSSLTFKKYSAQVLTYDIIRKQHGFRDTPYLLNIHRKPDGRLEFDNLIEISTSEERTFGSIIRNGIPLRDEVKIETLDRVNETLAKVFGSGSSIANELQELERDVAFFLNPDNKIVKDVTPDMADKYKDGYIKYFKNDITGERIFAKNETELKAALQIYLKELDNRSKSALITISKKFNKLRSIDELRDLLINNGYPYTKVDTAVMKLAKFVNSKWVLVDDPKLIANGCLLFQGKGRSEIVMIEDVKSLKEMHKFPNVKKGTTILGMLYGDYEIGSANKDILNAQYANLMMIKAMAIVSEYPEIFKNNPISNISALNIRRGESSDNVLNSTLLQNWKLISAKFKRLNLKQVDHCFMDDITACVNRARDMILMCENDTVIGSKGGPRSVQMTTNFKLFTLSPEKSGYSYKQLVEMWKHLKDTYGDYSDTLDYRLQRAYTELNKAILASCGFRTGTEDDVGLYLDQGFALTGGYMTPFFRSKSLNQRMIASISGTFHYKLHQELQKLITPFQVKLNKVLERSEKYTTGLSGEYIVSKDWFITEKDENGVPQFRIRSPSDPIYNEEERDLVTYVLETFAKLRWGDKNIEHLKANPQSQYYEMPLYESTWRETLSSSDNKIIAGLSLGKRQTRRLVNKGVDIVQGSETDITDAQSPETLNQDFTKNPFWDGNRTSKLETYGTDIFTKNIDDIFLYTAISAVKHNLSTELLPLFTSVRHLLQFENEVNNAGMEEILTAINQYIGTVIFDKSGVKGNLLSYQKLIQVFRQLFSAVTLGLNPKTLVRDTLSSNLRTATVLLNGGNDVLGIKSKDFFDAYYEMLKNSDSIFTSSGFYNQMNLLHRMSSMSYREIHDQVKTNKFSMANIDSQFLYLTTTSSDYIHRMALLKAYLRQLGIEDAYIMKNGTVTYDMSKDKRFAILFKYRQGNQFSINDRAKVPADKLDEYMKAWIEYEESIKDWQTIEQISIGDKLPLGLSPKQQQNVKNLANRLYGAYDKDEQALVHQTLLGGAFFQFKTYGISRLMDWWKRAGEMNIVTNSTVIDDESGEELWEVVNTKEEFEKTGEFSKLVPKSQVSNSDIISHRAQPLRTTNGAIDEGRVQSLYAAVVALYGAHYGDESLREEYQQEFENRLKNPIFRKNLLAGLIDIFMSLLLQGLIKIVYPEEAITNMNDQDWWTRWTYAVITGVAQDGPIWEVFNSVWGGGEIPVINGMSRWVTSAMGVINGNDLLPAMFNTFGATRELTSMLNNM